MSAASGLSATADYTLGSSGMTHNVSAADLDGAGHWEILVPSHTSTSSVDVYWGSASGWPSTPTESHLGRTFAAPLLVGPQ